MALYNGVTEEVETAVYLRKFAGTLRDSLRKRFQGIFVKLKMANCFGRIEGFNSNVFIAATVLDPNFKLLWLDDIDINFVEDKEKMILELKEEIEG